jgi:hypothetical protein
MRYLVAALAWFCVVDLASLLSRHSLLVVLPVSLVATVAAGFAVRRR